VNEKIEGFYAACKSKGLTGQQGVIIPASNARHLMLNDEVIRVVEKVSSTFGRLRSLMRLSSC